VIILRTVMSNVSVARPVFRTQRHWHHLVSHPPHQWCYTYGQKSTGEEEGMASWSWLHDSWIYNYLFNQCLSLL